MGHGLLRESFHCFYKLSPNAHEQHGTVPTKYGDPSVSHSVRAILQSDRRSITVCVTSPIPGAPCRFQCQGLATECGKRVRPTRVETTMELFG